MGMQWFRRVMNWLGVGNRTPEPVQQPAAGPDQNEDGQAMHHVGAGNVQIGQAGGSVRVVHLNQERHVTQVVHQHFYAVAGTPAQAPAAQAPAANDGAKLTPEQREVYTLMRQLRRRDYNRVVTFMREQLGTGLVQQLHGQALFRLRRYVETVQRNQEREQA